LQTALKNCQADLVLANAQIERHQAKEEEFHRVQQAFHIEKNAMRDEVYSWSPQLSIRANHQILPLVCFL